LDGRGGKKIQLVKGNNELMSSEGSFLLNNIVLCIIISFLHILSLSKSIIYFISELVTAVGFLGISY